MSNTDNMSYKLYAITDRSYLREGETLPDAVESAIKGGATIVQLREKELVHNDLKTLALSVKRVCDKYHVTFIINDDVALAKEIGADGVHLGADDMAIADARALLGDNVVIGATAKTIEQAKKAEEAGADYIGSGAVFGSDTKKDATPMSRELLDSICKCVSIPVVAIGGIDAYNVSELRDTSIAGVAVVSGIFARSNKAKASRDILCNLYGRPVVQCITNHVTIESVANTVLNFGASPIMSHNINEVEEVQTNATALYVNLGATDDYDAIKKAYKTALNNNHVIVIDPVGVSGITYRRTFLRELLSMGSPSCIRANVAEIRALHLDTTVSCGLESYEANRDDIVINMVRDVAKTYNTIVVASGVRDIISNGSKVIVVESGHALQKQLTGSGCMLSASIASTLSVGRINYADIEDRDFHIVADTCTEFGDAAARAAIKILAEDKGIYSFKTTLFDELM